MTSASESGIGEWMASESAETPASTPALSLAFLASIKAALRLASTSASALAALASNSASNSAFILAFDGIGERLNASLNDILNASLEPRPPLRLRLGFLLCQGLAPPHCSVARRIQGRHHFKNTSELAPAVEVRPTSRRDVDLEPAPKWHRHRSADGIGEVLLATWDKRVLVAVHFNALALFAREALGVVCFATDNTFGLSVRRKENQAEEEPLEEVLFGLPIGGCFHPSAGVPDWVGSVPCRFLVGYFLRL